MSAKERLIAAVQVIADATGNNDVRIAFGAPGNHLKNTIDEIRPTGQAWKLPDTGTWPIILEAIAKHLHGVRRITSSDNLETSDSVVELGSNGVELTLPAASNNFQGRYIIKAVNTTGTSVIGTVDGASGPFPVVAYQVMRVYCNGSQWLTW